MENEVFNTELEEAQVEIVEDTETAPESTEDSTESLELSEKESDLLQALSKLLNSDSADTGAADLTAAEQVQESGTVSQIDYSERLDRIHYDLMMILFLFLFFWMYERIKVACRNMKKAV